MSTMKGEVVGMDTDPFLFHGIIISEQTMKESTSLTASLLGLHMAPFSLCPHVALPLCTHIPSVILCAQICLYLSILTPEPVLEEAKWDLPYRCYDLGGSTRALW